MKVRDYTNRPDIVKAVQDARDVILACWRDWESEADENAQREQRNDAWFDTINAQIDCVLYGMLDQIAGINVKPTPPCGMPSHHPSCNCDGMGGDR